MRLLSLAMQAVLASCSLQWYTSQGDFVPPTIGSFSDEELIRHSVSQLHSITAAKDLSPCASCKTRLQVGKVLALTNRALVPAVFTTWCLEIGVTDEKCVREFGYPAEDIVTLGNDFTAMLQMMDPMGYDGDLFCYHHDEACEFCPEYPSVDLSHLWSPKPAIYEAPHPSGSTFNVLHISDINYQPDYAIISESNCSQQLCCRESSFNHEFPPENYDYTSLYGDEYAVSFHDSTYEKGFFEKGHELHHFGTSDKQWLPAHEFGAYNCDSPGLLINNTLQIIQDFHQNQLHFELGIFTGGIVSKHDTAQSKAEFLESQTTVYQSIKHYLGQLPIVSTFGAQDSFPPSQFPQASFPTSGLYQWQFNFMADILYQNEWLDFEASSQVRYSRVGFSLVTPRGLKIISLNSNAWNVDNLYAFANSWDEDSFGTWKFLVEELIESEKNDQRVWIMAHIAPCKDTMTVPTKAFTQIVQRFSPKVIAALFFGDALQNMFNVIYAENDNRDLENAVAVALSGPSLTPYGGNNPAWRYYSVDHETFDIMESFTFHTKMNQSFVNNGAEPVWELGEASRAFFDPCNEWPPQKALNAEFWHRAAVQLKSDSEFNNKFEQLKTRFSDSGHDSGNNGKANYCRTTSFTTESLKKCMIGTEVEGLGGSTEV